MSTTEHQPPCAGRRRTHAHLPLDDTQSQAPKRSNEGARQHGKKHVHPRQVAVHEADGHRQLDVAHAHAAAPTDEGQREKHKKNEEACTQRTSESRPGRGYRRQDPQSDNQHRSRRKGDGVGQSLDVNINDAGRNQWRYQRQNDCHVRRGVPPRESQTGAGENRPDGDLPTAAWRAVDLIAVPITPRCDKSQDKCPLGQPGRYTYRRGNRSAHSA